MKDYVRLSLKGTGLKSKHYIHPVIAAKILLLIAPHLDRGDGLVTTKKAPASTLKRGGSRASPTGTKEIIT